ncbi:MAG: RNB domain-containing ribonuclease [Verrucomicrobia bacterium]|nr:RNB domain-containing ribonuclease [Verrucomicrobiota bacterium]
MKLRDRLLAHVQQPGYSSANEIDLAKQLGLKKSERKSLAHEVRLLLSKGELRLVKGDRIALPVENEQLAGRIMFRAGGSAYFQPDVELGESVDPIQISPEDTGVALHGDRVAISVYAALQRRRDGRGTEQTGRVTRVITRARDTVVGTLQKIRSSHYVRPDDPRFFQEVMLPDFASCPVKPFPTVGDKVVVKLAEWTTRHKPLEGQIVERLGRTFEPRAELAGIYHKFNLDTSFPVEVEREVASLPDHVRPGELVGRLDYREVPTFTIDPDDAKDFDDALSLETLEDGDVRVGIHIADVSSYVKTGTALDREAQHRGNSTYLVGTVVPMLPEKLSNGLCSLVEAQDRLCKAVFLVFDKKSRLKETTYGNTVIRSRKRLTYRQAYALLFENNLEKIRALPLPPKHQTGSTGRALSSLTDLELVDLQSWVRKLWAIASKLRKDRMAHGSLDLDMPETKVFVDAEGYADRLEKIVNDESHQLIEEFMLSANEAVARLTKQNHLPSLYRVHDDPDEERLNEFRQLLGTFDIEVADLTVRAEMVKLIETLDKHPQGYTLRTQLLRSLRKACYRGTPDGHYGLHKKDYTHFTSPIRRYSDLVVHRVFDYYLIKHGGHPAPSGYQFGYTAGRMDSLGEHLSLTEVNSTEAERESVKIKLLEFFERELAKKQKTRFEAVITDVRPNGFFIELVESMTFGYVSANTLADDQYQLNNAGTMLVGRRTKKRYELNARLPVVIDKVDRFKRMMDFRPA